MAKSRYSKPTRLQKEILSGHGMDARKWLFVKQINDSYIQFINIETNQLKIVDVYKRKKLWGDI